MKFYNSFNEMFNAQSGSKKDMSVFNEDYAVFASKRKKADAGQIVFEMDNADDPTQIEIYYVPMDWKPGDSLDYKKYHKYPEYEKFQSEHDYFPEDNFYDESFCEVVNFGEDWEYALLDKDLIDGWVISPEDYDLGGGRFEGGLDADAFCREKAEEPANTFLEYDWRRRFLDKDGEAEAVKYLTEIFYKKNKKAMAEYLANK